MDYLEWNRILAHHFFNEEMAGREVILYVDNCLINKLGECYGANIEDFIEAIVEGPSKAYKKGICNKALWTLRRSQISSSYREAYPLYIAYLAFLVLAVDVDGDFSDHAYYPRINSLLEPYEEKIQPSSFKDLDELWLDLQMWSVEIKNERLGRFTTRSVGSWRHVGFPISQTLLTSEEREKLPIFFAQNGFDPSLPPDSKMISKAVCESAIFKNRTRKLILNDSEEYRHLRYALLALIQASLEDWDGNVPDYLDNSTMQDEWINTGLRLCVELDSFAMIAKFSTRFKSIYEFPDDEFEFIRQSDGSLWKSKGSTGNWSRPLLGYYKRKTTDATILNWGEEEVFVDSELRWKVRLRPSSVRVFIPGRHEGLNGWIETNRLESGTECLIACQKSYIDSVVNWGKESCDAFANLDFQGIPSSWCLFEAKNIIKSHPDIDVLKLPSTYSIRFKDGIKSGRGNAYFRLAPPKIYIEGFTGKETVLVNGEEISRDIDNIWHLPDDVKVNVPLKIELSNGETCLMSRYLTLEESNIKPIYHSPFRDKFGNFTEYQQLFIVSGINVKGVNYKDIPMYIAHPPTYMSQKIIFIGKHPDLYYEWPKSKIPDNWDGVWAIAKIKRDKWKVYFIGRDLAKCAVSQVSKTGPNWKRWKRILINQYVEPPKIQKLRDLWKTYKKEAEEL